MKRPSGGSASSLLQMANPNDMDYGVAGMDAEVDAEEEMSYGGGRGEKKRRLSAEQVRALERTFEVENKLEPERKARLARDLGLQPRQVAVWFQNRRARWKTKQLERDYNALRHSYDQLRVDHDALRRDKEALLAEIKDLKGKLGDEDGAASFTSVKEASFTSAKEASFTSVKEEPAASDGPPPAGVGSSDSDSSGVLNDTDATGATPAAEEPAPDARTLLGGPGGASVAVHGHGHGFYHGNFPKLEEDETGFLHDDVRCGGFFDDDEPPLLWWTEPTEPWK